jgi:hypothetical protein
MPSLLQNWISLFGMVGAASAFFAVGTLMAMDYFSGASSPYVGILTYIVAPGFLVIGLVAIGLGALLERRRRRRLAAGEIPKHPVIDFNVSRHRMVFGVVGAITFVFFLVSAIGSYQTFHFTESVEFCGETCHNIMQPEFTAYQGSAHARVSCVQCHIGSGAGWYVKSKLSGAYQVYAALAKVYPKPIPTPIENLRPAQDTCEKCHWPSKFYGNVERVNDHFFSDEENTPWTIRLLMKIGGGDPEIGRAEGIHWHMNIGNKVEYVATDHERQEIPWIRVTDLEGNMRVYQTPGSDVSPEGMDPSEIRQMDCMDCHNRPSHNLDAPARAVNLAMTTGRISTDLPFIKRTAVAILSGEYETTDEGVASISDSLKAEYAGAPSEAVEEAIESIQAIYRDNFFPEMKVDWTVYPDNLGHTLFPGCYRCHDGQHVSEDGAVVSKDCTTCHIIIGQGQGPSAETISPNGLEFQHPVDISELWKMMNCTECHTGGAE